METSNDALDVPVPGRWGRRRATLIVLGMALPLIILAGAGLVVVTHGLSNNIVRMPDVFRGLVEGQRPPVSAAQTFLLVGSDSRADQPTTGHNAAADVDPGSERSDLVMLVRIDRGQVTIVSIPRDSWVDIPGRGSDKINAAFAYGGPLLLVQTVERLTGIRVDHFAVIDFSGFRAMVDAVGGIDVVVAAPTTNFGVSFVAGLNHLDGAEALAYVRQRHDLPRGDLDRAHRQQNAMRAMLDKAASAGLLTDPGQLYRLLDAISRSVAVDDTLGDAGIRDLGIQLSGLRSADITFLQPPVRSFGWEDQQSVVHLDEQGADGLWLALRTGSVTTYAGRHPEALLGDSPP